jgi:TRAP transporter TAXI family solute receptor
MRRISAALALLAVASVLLADHAHGQDPKFIRILGGSVGGSWLTMGSKIADVLNREMPGVSATAVPSPSRFNMVNLEKGEGDIAFNYTYQANIEYEKGAEGRPPTKDVRHLMTLYGSLFQIAVPAGSDIRDVRDLLKGRRSVSVGNRGSLSDQFTNAIFRANGFTADDIRKAGGTIHYLGFSDSGNMMQDGQLDFVVYAGPYPHAAIMTLENKPGIRLLELSDSAIEKLLQEFPGMVRSVIPKGTYKGQNKDIPTVNFVAGLYVPAKMPDAVAYRLVSILAKNIEDLRGTFAGASTIALERALDGNRIPVHPGAARFYDERSIKVTP